MTDESPTVESSGQRLRALAVRAILRVFGWHLVGSPPDIPRCVIVFAPHISNWDFPLLFLVRVAYGKHVEYLVKRTVFRFPFGWFFRATRALPVERREHHHLVQAMVSAFEHARSYGWRWPPKGPAPRPTTGKRILPCRSGGTGADPAHFLDAQTRRCGVGPLLELTKDPERDLERLRDFYRNTRGIRPECESTIRFHP